MSETLTKIVVNCTTGQQEVVPLTEEEIAQRELHIAAATERAAEEQAAKEAKEAASESAKSKLLALGLSEEEISALIK